MRAVQVAKAEAIYDESFPDTLIKICGDLPQMEKTTRGCNKRQSRFQRDAKLLAEALKTSLPGGTLDELLIELLKNRACSLRVPLYREPKP